MNAKKTPLQQVNEEHGGKAKLVDKLVGMLDRGEEDKDSFKARLLAASNHKLLRLLSVGESVKSKYGSKDKLAEAVAGAVGRAKDADYVRRLGEYTPAKLLDMAKSFGRKAAGKAVVAVSKTAEKAKETAGKAKKKAAETVTKAKAAVKKKAPPKK